MKRRFFFALAAVVVYAGKASAAGDASSLEDLMKSNGRSYSAIEKGIAKSKFEKLPAMAQGIADLAPAIKRFDPPAQPEKKEEFDGLADRLAQDAQALKGVLASADADASRVALKRMEQTCKTCHQAFIPKKKK